MLQVIPTVPQFAVSRSDVICLFVFWDTSKWVTADISCLKHTKKKFFDVKDVRWRLCQHIAGILYESHANYDVMSYSMCNYCEWNDGQNADFASFVLVKHTHLDIKTQLACMWSISCTIQHLAQQNVNTRYNSQCSETDLFSTSSWQLWQIDKALHSSMSSREWRQDKFGGRPGPSIGSNAQPTISKEACGAEHPRNALCMQQRDREMDRGLCGERTCGCKNASSRRRDNNDARAERYDYCWKRGGDNQKA